MQADQFPILSAKIRVPPLPELYLPLPRIEQLMMPTPDAQFRGLVYVSAPPGYGKTSCLSRLSQFCGINHAWISFDALDRDPMRATTYLHQSLSLGGIPQDDSSADGSTSESILRCFHRIEKFGEPFLLLMDDLHEIANSPFFEALRNFLHHLPANCRVAMATREDLPLPLSLHRQAERLSELRQDFLRATAKETGAFLQLFGVELEQDAVELLERRTAGWWSCLKLFCISWRRLAPEERLSFLERFRAADRYVAEFLLESVYGVLNRDVASYAACAAVPEFFSTQLAQRLYEKALELENTVVCDALPASPHMAPDECLITLKKMNLITEGNRDRTYRFHPLLREYLKHTLSRQVRSTMHILCAEWFLANNMRERAQRHQANAERLLRGERPIAEISTPPSPPATTQDSPPAPHTASAGEERFSKREREMLQAVALGLSNDEIANKLFVSTGTVKWHLNNIYSKLSARNRTDAIHKARSLGILA